MLHKISLSYFLHQPVAFNQPHYETLEPPTGQPVKVQFQDTEGQNLLFFSLYVLDVETKRVCMVTITLYTDQRWYFNQCV